MTDRRRAPRIVAVVACVGLAASVSPLVTGVAGAADPLPPLADPVAHGAVCEGAPDESDFTDLGGESESTRSVIECLVATGLTRGTTATTYTPNGDVTRRQMALFIKRLADLLVEHAHEGVELAPLPAYDGDPDYPDVEGEEEDFAEAIGQLTQAGVVGGFPDGTFRPDDPVSRRQMAAFVNRLQDHVGGAPYSTDNDYFDDDEGDPGEDNLNALASAGIFQGDGQGNVNPGGRLTRRQMANILLRDAQVHFAVGAIDSPFGVPRPPAAPETDVTNADEGLVEDDVRVTYQRPALNDESVTYGLQRADADPGEDLECGSEDDPETEEGFEGVEGATEAPGEGEGTFVFSDDDVLPGCYAYRITATDPASEQTSASLPSDHTRVPGSSDQTGPTSVYAAVTTSGGTAADLDAGDVVTIVFSEPLAPIEDGDAITVSDGLAGGLTSATITAGTTGTFALNTAEVEVDGEDRAPGTVLTITLANDPEEELSLLAGVQLPATIVGQSGITDASGNGWNVGGSSDTELEQDT